MPDSVDKARRPLRRVVAVFKTHFDLGFTNLPDAVLRQYTGPIFEAVRDVIITTQKEPPGSRYVWTLPAWPMQQFLHGEKTPEQTRQESRRMVEEGSLRWHAWPFTTHTALCGLEDLVRGLHMSRSLAEEFGISPPQSAKQTDVPGHTWILPTLLVRAGVRFLHLGCNPGSHAPIVPRIFWWEGPDGSRLLTYYSQGGYGTSVLPPEDWTLDTWLALQQTNDNAGPQSAADLRAMRDEVARSLPGVELIFGTLDDFVTSLLEHPEQLETLPVVPYDLADTWIHGIGTMPREVARARAVRARLVDAEWHAAMQDWPSFGEGKGDFPIARRVAPYISAAYEHMLLFGEHTWGLDVKANIERRWGADFERARLTEPYKRMEASWAAHGSHVSQAEEELQKALETPGMPGAITAVFPSPVALREDTRANRLENDWLRVEINPQEGGIVSLFDKRTGREWVDKSGDEPFGGYRYDIYSAADIARHLRAYGLYLQSWFVQDFGKDGYPQEFEHVTAYARNFSIESREGTDGSSITIVSGKLVSLGPAGMDLPDQQVGITYKLAPGAYWLDVEYRIRGKAATPLAESGTIPFPLALPKAAFRLGQTGSVIDPARDIAAGANRHLWCADWLDASDDRHGFAVIPVDMPLVSVGTPGIYEFDPYRVPAGSVIYAHLFNTQWGTNFPQWLEGDFTFKLKLMPHIGNWREGLVWHMVYPAFHLTSASGLPRPVPLTLPPGLVLLGITPRHDGEGLIIRIWDALGLPGTRRLEIQGPVSSVRRCGLMEQPGERLPALPGAPHTMIDLNMAPHAVETLLVEFGEGSIS